MRRVLAPALLACLSQGRDATPDEIEQLAARIWRESCWSDRREWGELAPGAPGRSRVLAIAQAALGQRVGTSSRAPALLGD